MAVLKIKNELGQWVNIPSIKGEPGVEVSQNQPVDKDTQVWVKPTGTPTEILTKNELLDYMHPIGTIYKTDSPSFNPNTYWGGTWKKLEDVFLLCAGPKHPLGSSGGEEKHKLTIDEMPSHEHNYYYKDTSQPASKNRWLVPDNLLERTNQVGANTSGAFITSTGNSQPHNNMPPYYAVYVWKRTA